MRSIAILVDNKPTKRLLKRLLSPNYRLMRGRSSIHIPKQPFDLAIVDLPALERLRAQIEACREGLAPVLLPVLLVVSPQDINSDRFLDLGSSFDEVILSPIDEKVLAIRLMNLFMAKERTIQFERSYHALSQTSLAGVVIIQGRQVAFANQALADMVGLGLDDFLKLTPQQMRRLVHPDDRRKIFRTMLEVFKGDKPPFHTEFRYRRKDGTIRWVEMLVSRIDYNNFPALQATAIDITDRKRALEELRQRENALKKAQAVSHVGSWVWDIKTNRLQWSEEMFRIFGISKDAFSGDLAEVIENAIHPQDRDRVNRSNLAVIEDRAPEPLEYRIMQTDGSIRTVWAEAGELILDDAGEPAILTGILQDITERKQVEEALRQSQDRITSLYNSMREGLCLHELVYDNSGQVVNYRILDVNPRYEEILELKREKVIGHLATDAYGTQDPPFLERYSQVAQGGEPEQFEVYFAPMDRHFQISVFSPGKDQFATIFTDISHRKQIEEELRESQRRLSTLMDNLPGMAYRCKNTPEWTMEIVSLGCVELTGYSPADLILDKTVAFGELIYPDDRQEVWDDIQLAVKQKRSFQHVYRIRTAADRQKWVWAQGQGVFGEDGQVIALEGFMIDITERVLAEEAVRRSEERYRTLAETTADLIMVHDPEGMITYVNQAGLEFIGQSREEIYKRRCKDFIPAEYQDQLSDLKARRASGNLSTFRYETEMINRDGVRLPVDVRSTPIIQEGVVKGFLVVARDMTDRKQAEEERDRLTDQIRDQASEMKQILETVPAGVVMLDAEGVIQQANPVAEYDLITLASAKVGNRLSRLGSRSLYEVLSPPPNGLWHEIEAGDNVYEVIARPMEEGSEEGSWVLVINDVTRDREIRKQLQQQGQLAAVGQLAAGIAHDFNNIIAIIGLYAELGLNAPGLDKKIAERFGMIEHQANRAAHLTQQIMDFSRSSVLKRQPMNLCTFFEEFGQLMEETLPKDIQVEMYNQAEICSVNADSTRLQQALLNLVLNARDAMYSVGGGKIQMTLSEVGIAEPVRCFTCGQVSSGDWIRIEVVDQGSGIEPDVLTHIFEPFFTTKDIGQGTGLGLAQVYGIVKQHDGHIDVESAPGQGTTFRIYLPISFIDPVVLESYEGTGRVFGRGEKILLVEDSQVLRGALRETLEQLNYVLLEAENGNQALDILESEPDIALVLSDLVMPEMGGQTMFREMHERGLAVPVVMLSGHPMESELARLKLEGLAGWLLKPPTPDQLASMISAVLKGN